MSEHTPGPWVAETLGNPYWTIHPPNAPGVVAQYVKVEADARLIAAAPDLLAATVEAADGLHGEYCTGGGWATCSGWQHAKQNEAIAKATQGNPQ